MSGYPPCGTSLPKCSSRKALEKILERAAPGKTKPMTSSSRLMATAARRTQPYWGVSASTSGVMKQGFISGRARIKIINCGMEQDRYLPRNEQVYKNPNWAERKKELKTTRNQRTTKSIKNIRSIDTPADPLFNYTAIDAAPSARRPPKYCDITGYQTKYKDSVSGLYFYDKAVSSYIKMLSKPVSEQFLIMRGETPIDKVV